MDPKEGYDAVGYAAHDAEGELKPFKFKRRFPGPDDVVVEVTHCGICYAEIVWTRNHIGDVQYPVVPGHEVVGVVKEVGKNVTKFKAGDRVGVGYIVMSCGECESCQEHHENYCEKGCTRQFNQIDLDNTITRGGFSNLQVTNQRYVVQIPDALSMEHAAPMLCAGLTVWIPLSQHVKGGGKKVGIGGLGGLGHLAVKIAKAMGNHVTVFSTSESKREEAVKVLGADVFIISKDQEAMKAAAKSLDIFVDCAAGVHPIDPYLSLLKHKGVLHLVGVAPELKITPILLCRGRTSITGSVGGGTTEVEEMLNFVAEKGVEPMIELIPIDYVNTAMARLENNDVRYRFVIDIEKSLKS